MAAGSLRASLSIYEAGESGAHWASDEKLSTPVNIAGGVIVRCGASELALRQIAPNFQLLCVNRLTRIISGAIVVIRGVKGGAARGSPC